jgi:hypothetical protein
MVHQGGVAAAIIDALTSLDLKYPEVSDLQRKELAAAKETLESLENDSR